MTEPIIQVRGVTQEFGDFKALDDVSLDVAPGSVYGLVGPNGSGKTTLTRIIAGLKPPTKGNVRVVGLDLPRGADRVRASVGYMSQRFSLYDDLTARENIAFFAEVYGFRGKAAKRRFDQVVTLLELGPYLERLARNLSGGWRQRLALATTLMHSPALMLLDEPTAGIDPVARRSLWDLLFEIAAGGATIFMTTQYMDEVERCTDVGYIYLSRLIKTGTPDELKQHVLDGTRDARYVEIVSPNAIKGVGWLRAQSYCSDATVFGQTIHAVVDASIADDALASLCLDAGMRTPHVRSIEPSLEDVFVALTNAAAKPE